MWFKPRQAPELVWPKEPEETSNMIVIVPTVRVDLVMAQDDGGFPFVLYHKECGGEIDYDHDYLDPPSSRFICTGPPENMDPDEFEVPCGWKAYVQDLMRFSDEALGAVLYTGLHVEDQPVYKLEIVHERSVAYTTARKASRDERFAQYRKRIQYLRDKYLASRKG